MSFIDRLPPDTKPLGRGTCSASSGDAGAHCISLRGIYTFALPN